MHQSVHDAELAVVGSLLLNPEKVDVVREHINADSLEDQTYAAIFAAMSTLRDSGKKIDALTVSHELDERGRLKEIGGMPFLANLTSQVPTSANVEHYAVIVRDAANKRDVATLLKSGAAAAENGTGADAVVENLLADLEELGIGRSDSPVQVDVAALLANPPPEMDYLFDEMLPRGIVSGCDAAGGGSKSIFAQQLITSACTGRTLLESFRPVGTLRVLWLESEDPADEIHRRQTRITKAFGLDEDDIQRLASNLTLYAGVAFPLNRVEDGVVTPSKHFRWLEREVKRVQPDLIVIDPRSHYFAGEENSNTEVAAFMNLLRRLTEIPTNGATVWVNHHVSKMRQGEASSAAGRGASAARDAQRCLFTLTPLSKEEMERAGITSPSAYVRLDGVKSNWTPGGNGPIYLRRMTGDTGGVLVETDLSAMRAQADEARLMGLAKELADLLGDNDADLRGRDIGRAEGQELRESLKASFGRFATIPNVKRAMDLGLSTGLLVPDKTGVPRAAKVLT